MNGGARGADRLEERSFPRPVAAPPSAPAVAHHSFHAFSRWSFTCPCTPRSGLRRSSTAFFASRLNILATALSLPSLFDTTPSLSSRTSSSGQKLMSRRLRVGLRLKWTPTCSSSVADGTNSSSRCLLRPVLGGGGGSVPWRRLRWQTSIGCSARASPVIRGGSRVIDTNQSTMSLMTSSVCPSHGSNQIGSSMILDFLIDWSIPRCT
ncbi:Os08g0140000 [Oryza sativa Japonica Group]|uniref:Os08g0140000 protein n=1 Tax=Oryza sativa subsp. japonica TaxID=39947 RepID=A0A0P0XBS2_ORYSJ|nr:Os08g0140000 [Oryza sativa Japonica Group]